MGNTLQALFSTALGKGVIVGLIYTECFALEL